MILKKVFEILKHNNVSINFGKCNFFKKDIKFLGQILQQGKLKIDISQIKEDKIKSIPKSHKQLRSLIGYINWFRPYVPHMSNYISKLNDILKDKVIKWGFKDMELQKK